MSGQVSELLAEKIALAEKFLQKYGAELVGATEELEAFVHTDGAFFQEGLLPVAQKQVLADLGAKHPLHLVADLNGVGVVVVHPDVWDGQLLQPAVDGQLLGDAAGGIRPRASG